MNKQVVKPVFTLHCSLGKESRQLELMRITSENQMILLRLSQCRAYYNVRSWHEDWLKTLKVMDSIACYPRGSANPQKGYFFFRFLVHWQSTISNVWILGPLILNSIDQIDYTMWYLHHVECLFFCVTNRDKKHPSKSAVTVITNKKCWFNHTMLEDKWKE